MDAFPRFDLTGRTTFVTGASRSVARAVDDLASPAASIVTGHTVPVDDGWTAR